MNIKNAVAAAAILAARLALAASPDPTACTPKDLGLWVGGVDEFNSKRIRVELSSSDQGKTFGQVSRLKGPGCKPAPLATLKIEVFDETSGSPSLATVERLQWEEACGSEAYLSPRKGETLPKGFKVALPFEEGRSWKRVDVEDSGAQLDPGLWTKMDAKLGELLRAYLQEPDLKEKDQVKRAAAAPSRRSVRRIKNQVVLTASRALAITDPVMGQKVDRIALSWWVETGLTPRAEIATVEGGIESPFSGAFDNGRVLLLVFNPQGVVLTSHGEGFRRFDATRAVCD